VSVKSQFNPPHPPLVDMCKPSAALKPVRHELCGPRVGRSWPALIYSTARWKS